jgi:hypothetical protein
MYEDVGIRKEIAIQKVHRVINEENRHGPKSVTQAHRITSKGNRTNGDAELTPKFLDVYKEIPVSANRQYTLLRLVTQPSEPIQQKAQETNLSETYLKQVEENLKSGKVWAEKEGIGFGLGGRRDQSNQ